MGYFDLRTWPEKDSLIYREYLEKLLIGLCGTFTLGRPSCSLLEIPSAIGGWVIEDLLEILEAKWIDRNHPHIEFPHIEHVEDLMFHLLPTDLVIAFRFHEILLLLLSRKPVLALSYHPKIDALMAHMGLEDFCFPWIPYLDVVKERFMRVRENKEPLRRRIERRIRGYREVLDTQYHHTFAAR